MKRRRRNRLAELMVPGEGSRPRGVAWPRIEWRDSEKNQVLSSGHLGGILNQLWLNQLQI